MGIRPLEKIIEGFSVLIAHLISELVKRPDLFLEGILFLDYRKEKVIFKRILVGHAITITDYCTEKNPLFRGILSNS